jgi:hypothetical protein
MRVFLGAAMKLLVGVLAVAALAGAADARAAATQAAPLRELPDIVLEPWKSTQTAGGNFVRPSGSQVTGGYGNGAIAYGMLIEAARTGDESDFRSAMAAFNYMVHVRIPVQGVFYPMFTAAAFNLARERFAGRPEFEAIRKAWQVRLRTFKWPSAASGRTYRNNKDLVLALAALELHKTGLHSKGRGRILSNRGFALRRAVRTLNVAVPRVAYDWSRVVDGGEGWPFAVRLADVSDPPSNAPAYNALVAGVYARAYEALPVKRRTARMRRTATMLLRGVIARTAPDGDLAFAGRSQEQAWALSFGAYAAWAAAARTTGPERNIYLGFAKRVVSRLENVHVSSSSSQGFLLTPAQGCCDRVDNPPGQDHYFDIASYSGLAALTLGWAIAARPADWETGAGLIPTDSASTYVFGHGRGRFMQYRGTNVYWMLRLQSDFEDARSDLAPSVLKLQHPDGSWTDAVPPRPYSGGHGRPADPAAPCLAIGKDLARCAYMELRSGRPTPAGYVFRAKWRRPNGHVMRKGTVTVLATERGLKLSWLARSTSIFKLDNFLPGAVCTPTGVASSRVSVTVVGQTGCRVLGQGYAGGSRVDLDRIRSVAGPVNGVVSIEYTATS